MVNLNSTKQLLLKTHLLIDGYVREQYPCIIPTMILIMFKLFWQQIDTFKQFKRYQLSNNNQTAIRVYDDEDEVVNITFARIYGQKTIYYNKIINSNINIVKYVWKIKIDKHPGEFDVGIIDKSILDQENEFQGGADFIGHYGIDQDGEARYIEDPPQLWMHPIYNQRWMESCQEINEGSIICIELQINAKNGKVIFWVDEILVLEYPWVYPHGKYGLYIKMLCATGQCTIKNYECTISH